MNTLRYFFQKVGGLRQKEEKGLCPSLKQKTGKRKIGYFLFLFLLTPASTEAKVIGTSGDWVAHKYQEKKKDICYVAAQPMKAEGNYQKRGEIQFMISIRPADKIKGEVSCATGYTYHTSKPAFIKIEKKQFTLIPHQDRAWLENNQADLEVIQAMKQGTVMVVEGSSARGTQTKDTYSLKGFTKGYEMARAACGMK